MALSLPLEVDYRRNPTELLRWINCKRWDGAIHRCSSHPDETKTWITSKYDDGTSRWRYLPLHLVCMESPPPQFLVESLLRVYPEASRMQDHKEMLPIHYACENGAGKRVVELLVKAYPASVDRKDGCGRTPMAIAKESSHPERNLTIDALQNESSFPKWQDDNPKYQNNDPKYQNNLNYQNDGPKYQNNPNHAKNDHHNHNNHFPSSSSTSSSTTSSLSNPSARELKKELRKAEKKIYQYQEQLKTVVNASNSIEKQFHHSLASEKSLLAQLSKVETELSSTTDECAKLKERNEFLTHANLELKAHIQNGQPHPTNEREEIHRLSSEVSTAKAMSEALEAKLQGKFASEQILSEKVCELETTLENERAARTAATAGFRQRETALQTENASLRSCIEKLTANNASLQKKVKQLTEAVVGLVGAMNSLSSGQEQIAKSQEKSEKELLDAVKEEREALVKAMTRQREYMANAAIEQETIVRRMAAKEERARSKAREEREGLWKSIAEQKRSLSEFGSTTRKNVLGVAGEKEGANRQDVSCGRQ